MENTRPTSKERTLYIVLIITACVMVIAMLYMLSSGTNMVSRLGPRVDAIMEIGVEATLSHLWLMESVIQPEHRNLDSALNHLEMADTYVKAMLEGGKVNHIVLHSEQDPEIRRLLEGIGTTLARLEELALTHTLADHGMNGSKRQPHEHDPFFTNLLNQTAQIEHQMRLVIDTELAAFQRAQTLLIITTFGFFALVAIAFYRYLREERANRLRIRHLNLVLRAVRNVTQIITRESDRERLIKRTCELLVETRGFHNAWITLVDDGGRPSIWAEAGLADGFTPAQKLLNAGSLVPCCQKALKIDGVVVISDPPKECADCPLAQEYIGRAGLAIRLEHFGKIYGYMVVSTPHNYAVDSEEQQLYSELADDIALKLHLISVEEERNLAEEALRSSEERYRTLAANIPGSDIFLFDSDLRFQLAEGTEMKRNKRSKEFYEGKTLFETWQKPAVEVMEPAFKMTLQGKPTTSEFKCCNNVYSLLTVPLFDENQAVTAGLAMTVNITERKRDEAALRLTQFSIDRAADAVFWADKTLRFIRVNETACRLLGYSAEELCRLHFYEVSPDFPSDRCDEQWAIAKKDGFFSLETTQRTKDGRLIPVEVSVSYMPFNGQEYLCGFVRDITERKKASEALVQSEEKYRSLFATMAQGVVYQDKDGRVTSANSSAERILGLPIEEMLGATSSDPRWKAITEEGIEYAGKDHPAMIALRTGEPVNNAIMGVYNPEIDDYRWLTIDAIPQYRPGEEEPYQVYTTFSDITERRQMEQAISESEEKFRMISEQSLLGIAILQDNQIKYANSAAAGIFELDREKQSNPALDVIIPLIHEDDREYVSDQLQKKQAGIKDVNNHYSFRVTPLSGNKKWIDVFSRTVSYEGRTANFATLVDITDRKRHEMIQAAHLKISEATNLSSNLESLLATIHQSLGELIDTTNFYVALYDEKNEMYSFPYCVDQNDNADFTPDDLKKSLTDYVRRTGQPLLVNEEIQMELEARGEVDLIGVPSDLWMGVPLKSANGVLGVAVVQSYTDPQCYSKDDLELMTFISGYITMALERKLAEQALRSSEERLRAMYEQASVGVALLSTDGRWLTVNERLCEIVGYSREELLQMTARDITHPDDLEDSPCILDHQLFNTPKNCKCEKRYIRKDGNIVWLTMSAALVIEPSDAEEYLFAVLEDITVRKQAELALKHSEERFRAMFEQAAIGVATISCDGTWLRVNQTMRDITGYSHEELKQMTIHDLTYPDDFQVSPKQIERIVNGEIDHYQIEKRYVRKDGEVVWVHVSASMLGEPGSNEAYLMTVIQDITERKNAEDMVAQYTDQLLKANRDLQAKQAELEEFIYTVSHDLKAPVVSISGFSGLISEKFGDALDDTGTRYLDRIRYNSEVMEELIGDLLELSRIDRADEETNPVNGDTLVDEILESFSVAAANKNVRLIKLCRLPDIDGRLHRVRQLITNLVDNAIKYMPDRQDALVEVGFDPDTLSPDGVSGAFFVRDNGAGIPEEFHGRIFGMFQRVRSNGSQAEGSGVGLAVVKRIVEKHGGELWIKSEVGKGTTFYFTLPVLRRSHPVGSSDEDSQPGHSPGVSKKAL